MVWISVEVHNGRLGRNPSFVTSAGGEVLLRFETDVPYAVGDLMQLPDGTEGKIISVHERIGTPSVQVVAVGDAWG